MITDPANTDVGSVVEDIRNHRFDSYHASQIALEIELFRSGVGTGSIDEAVDSLGRVAAALENTESTLRDELSEIGVSWQGRGSEGALTEFDQQAGFAAEMAETLHTVSRVLFEQGDAFNQTRAALPEADEVRKAVGGRSIGDNMAGLFGFETDHAEQVSEGTEAKEHAVQILNEYVQTSGNGLGSLLDKLTPRIPTFDVASGQSGEQGGSRVPPDSGDSSGIDTLMNTNPASSMSGAPSPGAGSLGSVAVPWSGNTSGAGSWSPAATGTGVSGAGATGAAVPSTTTAGVASSAEPAGVQASGNTARVPAAHAGSAGHTNSVGGHAGTSTAPRTVSNGPAQPDQARSGYAPSGAGERAPGRVGASSGSAAMPARTVGRVTVPAPGGQAPTSALDGRSYTPLSPVGGTSGGASGGTGGSPSAPLAKGSMSGVGPQASSTTNPVGTGAVPPTRSGMRATDVGAGMAALGAGGAAGGMSSGEPQGRGVGRSAPNAGSAGRSIQFGAAPDEEIADAVRRVDGDSSRSREPSVLQRATDDDDGAEHPRSFGVDHADLFADDRLVAPERIETGEMDGLDDGR